MNLINICSMLSNEKLYIYCIVDENNPNILKIDWSGNSKNGNKPTWIADPMTRREKKRKFIFNASCDLKIDFDKILHLWDNETDEKFNEISQFMNNESGTKSAIKICFPRYLDKVIPILEKKDYASLKEFFNSTLWRIQLRHQSHGYNLFKSDE